MSNWITNILNIINPTNVNADTVNDHFHNYEYVFGVAAVPTATHFGDMESLTPYELISGNNAFGAGVGLIGTAIRPCSVH